MHVIAVTKNAHKKTQNRTCKNNAQSIQCQICDHCKYWGLSSISFKGFLIFCVYNNKYFHMKLIWYSFVYRDMSAVIHIISIDKYSCLCILRIKIRVCFVWNYRNFTTFSQARISIPAISELHIRDSWHFQNFVLVETNSWS